MHGARSRSTLYVGNAVACRARGLTVVVRLAQIVSVVAELLPSVLMLLVTRHRASDASAESSGYPTSDITRSSSIPDAMDAGDSGYAYGYPYGTYGTYSAAAASAGDGGDTHSVPRYMPVRSSSWHERAVTGPLHNSDGFANRRDRVQSWQTPGHEGSMSGHGRALLLDPQRTTANYGAPHGVDLVAGPGYHSRASFGRPHA